MTLAIHERRNDLPSVIAWRCLKCRHWHAADLKSIGSGTADVEGAAEAMYRLVVNTVD